MVTGKYLLIALSSYDNYWIDYPVYQAALKGAAGVFAMVKNKTLHENAFMHLDIVNDVSLPVLFIEPEDGYILKSLIATSPHATLQAQLTAQSFIEKDATSFIVCGDLPGKTEEVIYLTTHYDSYYHPSYDNIAAVSLILGILQTLLTSGYQPYHTLRLIAHGAIEWQKVNTMPETTRDGFAFLNIDGRFALSGQKNLLLHVAPEFTSFIQHSVAPLLAQSTYHLHTINASNILSEDLSYSFTGMPFIVADKPFDTSIYFMTMYPHKLRKHPFDCDHETYTLLYMLFGTILMQLDRSLCMPFDFTTRFNELMDSFDPALTDALIITKLIRLINLAHTLTDQLTTFNQAYAHLPTKRLWYNLSVHERQAETINTHLLMVYKKIEKNFFTLNFSHEMVFTHTILQKNIQNLAIALEALHMPTTSLLDTIEHYILPIDTSFLVPLFDYTCYNFFTQHPHTPSTPPHEDLYQVIQQLYAKVADPTASIQTEIDYLQDVYIHQQTLLKAIHHKECAALDELIGDFNTLLYLFA